MTPKICEKKIIFFILGNFLYKAIFMTVWLSEWQTETREDIKKYFLLHKESSTNEKKNLVSEFVNLWMNM